MRWLRALLLAAPALALAGFGLAHPHLLTEGSAHRWWTMHVLLLPLFPLVAGALLVLLRGDRSPVAWAARVAGYGFAVGYTALDVLAGIGAGLVVDTAHRPEDDVVGRLFQIGDRIGRAGVWALLVAGLLTAAARWPRHGPWVLPGTAVFTTGCAVFMENHIFAPRGVWAMVALAAGTALLSLAPERSAEG